MKTKLPRRLAVLGFAGGFLGFLLTGGFVLLAGLPLFCAAGGAVLGAMVDGYRWPRAWAVALGTPIIAVVSGALYGILLDGTGISNQLTRTLTLAGALYSLPWLIVGAYVAELTPPARS